MPNRVQTESLNLPDVGATESTVIPDCSVNTTEGGLRFPQGVHGDGYRAPRLSPGTHSIMDPEPLLL